MNFRPPEDPKKSRSDHQWPCDKQIYICIDPYKDHVRELLRRCDIPQSALPHCPACRCRQVPVYDICRPMDNLTPKEREQQESYLRYLDAFKRACICDAAAASRVRPDVPCCSQPTIENRPTEYECFLVPPVDYLMDVHCYNPQPYVIPYCNCHSGEVRTQEIRQPCEKCPDCNRWLQP